MYASPELAMRLSGIVIFGRGEVRSTNDSTSDPESVAGSDSGTPISYSRLIVTATLSRFLSEMVFDRRTDNAYRLYSWPSVLADQLISKCYQTTVISAGVD